MSIRHVAAGAGLAAVVVAGSLTALAGQGAPAAVPLDFSALRWRHLGPVQGGLTTDVAGDPADPRVFYLGTAGGGLWTTGDYDHH